MFTYALRARAHHALMYSTEFFLGALLFDRSMFFNLIYWSLFITVLILNITVYTINDYFDRFDDALDEKKKARNLFCSKKTFQPAKRAMLLMVLLTLALSFISPMHLLVTIGFYAIILSYSHPLIKLKGKPVFDILVHILWWDLIFSAGWFYSLEFNYSFMVLAISVAAYSASGQLAQQVRDLKVDSESGLKTSANIMGESTSRFLQKSLFACSIVILSVMTILEIV